MAALVLAGVTFPVASGGRLADETVGDVSRSLNGACQVSILKRKRAWTFTTPPIARAVVQVLRPILSGAAFSATGDVLGGETVSVLGEIEDAPAVAFVTGGSLARNPEVVTFTLREV